ncbi:IclR family transcriptional regulator [Nocardia sp. NPDC046763]|uniref:IclR family transcriptional regulator n=1 Tax=Nocardia sp. NPDC046763 TaxID=3155256 RepID=UPI0033D42066
MAGNTTPAGATVISRVLALLGAFDEHHRRLTLTQLARRTGLSPATVYRHTGELVAGGVLTRNSHGEYMIGHKMWELGLLAPVQTDLRQVASPFLQDLYATTRATVHLAIREDTEVLYLERLSGNASVPVLSWAGSKLPLHATGVGKVLLAYAPPRIRERVLQQLPRFTRYTVTEPARLTAQLSAVRRHGYATTVEEMTLGACSVAVPVHTPGRDTGDIAALGIVVPALPRDRARLTAALHVTAQGISRSLPPPTDHPGPQDAPNWDAG